MKISQINPNYKVQGVEVIRFIFGDGMSGVDSDLSKEYSLLKSSNVGTIGFCDVVIKEFQISKKFPCDSYNVNDYDMKKSFCILLIGVEEKFRNFKSTKQILEFLEQKAYSMNINYVVGLDIENYKIINILKKINYQPFMYNKHCVKKIK